VLSSDRDRRDLLAQHPYLLAVQREDHAHAQLQQRRDCEPDVVQNKENWKLELTKKETNDKISKRTTWLPDSMWMDTTKVQRKETLP
jgi:hypothetical protein